MYNLIKTGRAFFGICLIGLGAQQFQYGEFRPVFVPDWPAWLHNSALAYIFGAALILAGGVIALAKNARKVALISVVVFLLFSLFFHSVFLSFISPDKFSLGAWTNALKELALSGGALIIAGSYPQANTVTNDSPFSWLEKLIPFGRIFFGMFWTYFAGIALFGAGVAFIFNFRIRLVAILTAVMIFIWFLVLHIPRGIADPEGLKGNEITSVFEALVFAGVALIIYALYLLPVAPNRTPAVSFPNEARR